jgi:hypothetical protein
MTARVLLQVLCIWALLGSQLGKASIETELHDHRGVVAYGEGRLDQARLLFEKVLAEDPDDKATLQYLALIAQGQGEIEFAMIGTIPADDPSHGHPHGRAPTRGVWAGERVRRYAGWRNRGGQVHPEHRLQGQ